MKKILYIICVCLVTISCERRTLTYSYNPTVEVVVNVDWSDMSVAPEGLSIYCYPETGESPTIKIVNLTSDEQAAMASSTTINLGVGEYKFLVFNQTPSEFSSINFSGMSSYESAEVYASNTTSRWYVSKSEETLVVDPDELAAATYHSVEITQEAIDEVLGLREKYIDTDEQIEPYATIDLAAAVVIKTTRVTVKLNGINNLSSVRATLYGMATGYNFSTQTSHSDYATHLLESWSIAKYAEDVTKGEIVAYFTCFGIPGTTTETRVLDSSWGGTMHLEMLLVDLSTITETDHVLHDKTTLMYDDVINKSDEDDSTTQYDDSDVDISVDVDDDITLDDVMPEGGSSGGFDASVGNWEDEQQVEIPT